MSNILLSNQFIKSTCKLALNEDLYPSGDITSDLINNNINKKVKMIINQRGIIGGLAFAKETFKLTPPEASVVYFFLTNLTAFFRF